MQFNPKPSLHEGYVGYALRIAAENEWTESIDLWLSTWQRK